MQRNLRVPFIQARWSDGQIETVGPGAFSHAFESDTTFFYRGEIFSIPGEGKLSPGASQVAGKALQFLLKGGGWGEIDGQFSAILIRPSAISAFRSALSPHLLFYDENGVSDRLALLASKSSRFSFDYLEKFVLDYPSLQFSSELTPFEKIYRLPSSAEVKISKGASVHKTYFPFEKYQFVDRAEVSRESLIEEARALFKEILVWNLAKEKPTHGELSGGLDSSFICALLSDLTGKPFPAHMYAYRKHPSHTYSEECAMKVAAEKNINLTIVDSAEIPGPDLTKSPPYQDEPIDFYWQGLLFGPICQRLIPEGSLLYTGFGGDQLFMRGNEILSSLYHQKKLAKLSALLPQIAHTAERSTLNFIFQFGLSILPRPALLRLLDATRSLRLNPFRVDELIPEITDYERVDWIRIYHGKNPSAWLKKLKAEGETLEERFFRSDVPHSNLNYLIAPSLVIGPYLEEKGIQYVHPYCDKRLIDFIFRKVPWNYIYDFKNLYKHFLREIQKGVMPEEVRLRDHDDFSCDGFYYSLLNENRGFFRELLVNAAKEYPDWIDEKALLSTFQKKLFGSYGNSELKLARFMGYLVWKHHFQRYLA